MTHDPVGFLSTFPHRLYHDIRLSNDIGRDSPMDPFQGRDMTVLFSKKKDTSRSLMYFAQKPLRRPPGSVVMAKQADTKKGPSIYPANTQATYDVKYPMDKETAVSFTTATRWVADDARNKRLEERRQVILTRREYGDTSPIELMYDQTAEEKPGTYLGDILSAPNLEHAPSIGKYAGRGWDKKSPEEEEHPKKKLAKWTVFPWERRKKKKVEVVQPPTAEGAEGGGASALETTAQAETTTGAQSTTAPSTVQAQPHPTTTASKRKVVEEEEEEKWLKERKTLLARFGLSGGTSRRERLRRRAKPKGADIGSHVGREAPVFHLAGGQQLTDAFYVPKYDVTTRERKKYADVKLGSYAKRHDDALPPHIATVNRVLDLSRLAKFHQRKLKEEQESALALPNARPSSVLSEKPLSGADELCTNPKTLYAPETRVTRLFKGSPDVALYSDRPNEPLGAVLGGDPRKYRRILRTQDRAVQRAQTAPGSGNTGL